MLQKDGSILIGNWNKGQVKHPIYGFGLLQNVDVFENKGIAKIKNRLLADSSITPTDLPIAEVYNGSDRYTLTLAGICYKNGIAIPGASGLTNPWDLTIKDDYVWCRYSTVLDAYGPLSSAGAAWYRVDSGYNGSYNGKLLTAQDGIMYAANGNTVAKINITSSGTVGAAPTVSSNKTALDLKDGQFATTIWEFGRDIRVGTQGGLTYSDRGNYPTARIYPWNRQLGTLGNPGLADLPIVFNESGFNAAITHANIEYISAGTNGNIYKSDGTNFVKIATLPYVKTGLLSVSTVYANALTISPRGTLLVGLSGGNDDYSKVGIYEIDITASADPLTGDYPVSFQTISTASTGSTGPIGIGFINARSYQSVRVGWRDGSTYGVDDLDPLGVYPSYSAVIESELEQVGTSQTPKTYEQAEFNLAEPLVAGQNIRLSYRTSSKGDYTLVGTWGFSDQGTVPSFTVTAPMTDLVFAQVKIELDQATTSAYGSNVNLINARIF